MTQKVALVKGGATGIGKATAMILARKGVKVVISGRREALAQKEIEESARRVGKRPSLLRTSTMRRRSVRLLNSR